MSDREFDLIVFGATGFTGQFVVEEVARTSVEDAVKWAVAGRSKDKLDQTLKDASKEVEMDLTGVTKIGESACHHQNLLIRLRKMN